MSDISITNTYLGNQLSSLLNADNIQPGSQAGYDLCKQIWEYHPLGGKLVEKPVRLALSKPRVITIDAQPKEMIIEAFEREWEKLGATNHIRDVMFINRTYGAGGIVVGADDIPTTDPIDPWKLPDLNIYFNQLDPLNMAGSIVTNQNPNAPDFQKPLAYTTAAGQPYHPSRSVVVFNGTPIYLSFQSSAFGFTGRSVFQRALYPLKSFVQSMVTDDLVTFKAGLLIAKQKPAGSIVNRLMQTAAGIKRTYLQEGATGNVLSIDIDEEISAIDMNNTATSMTTARDNIIANIAAASDVPAILLKDEAFTQGFGEGTEDAKAIVQYIDGIRVDMASLFSFFDKIVMHRAWNREFFEAIQNKYPEVYRSMTYEQAFYQWQNSFRADWESLMEEPESEKVKVEEIKLKGITEILRTLLPAIDPTNRAVAIQWAQDNLNEMPEMFASSMQLDIEAIAEYEPPEPLPELKEPAPRADEDRGLWAVPTPKLLGNDAVDFHEADHPRDTDGKFTNSGGGSLGKATATITAPAPAGATTPPQAPREKPKAPAVATKPPAPPTEQTSKKHLEETFSSKDLKALSPEAAQKLEKLYEVAAKHKDSFDSFGESIAKEIGGKYNGAPLKSSKRATEKIVAEYGGNVSKIKDILRSTIEVNDLQGAQTAITEIKAKYKVVDSSSRNLLDVNIESNLFGYRDAKFNIEIEGMVAEIQVNLPEMLKAKEKHHADYEVVQKIDRLVAMENRTHTPEEAKERNDAISKMEEGYNQAWQEAINAKKPA